jgi:hypothetical protein
VSVSDRLSKDITSLVKPERAISPLQRVRQNEAIEKARGRGLPSTNPSTDLVIPNVRREVLTVYSSLIITEDGAFEKPPGWPTTGTYPGSGFVLNTSAQYYEQRRVHYIIMESLKSQVAPDGTVSYYDPELIEEQMFVPLAEPFEGKYFQGVVGYTNFYPALFMNVSPVTVNGGVAQIMQRLQNEGVTLV